MEATALARSYYAALDEHRYDRLASLLAPTFVQYRPDLTLESRDRFVRFMREERPDSETEHVVERTFTAETGDVAVAGRLVGADGERITAFVDVFSVQDGTIRELRTYTNGSLPVESGRGTSEKRD